MKVHFLVVVSVLAGVAVGFFARPAVVAFDRGTDRPLAVDDSREKQFPTVVFWGEYPQDVRKLRDVLRLDYSAGVLSRDGSVLRSVDWVTSASEETQKAGLDRVMITPTAFGSYGEFISFVESCRHIKAKVVVLNLVHVLPQ